MIIGVIKVVDINCVFCDSHLEDKDHIFFKYDVIKVVRKKIGE